MELMRLNPNFLTSSSYILKEMYIQENIIIIFNLSTLDFKFLYASQHLSFSISSRWFIVYFFGFPNFFFEVGVWRETSPSPSLLPCPHEEPPSLSCQSPLLMAEVHAWIQVLRLLGVPSQCVPCPIQFSKVPHILSDGSDSIVGLEDLIGDVGSLA
jgi:hypothetical protein